MINLRKSILGLVALIMVFGLVFTVSAFKYSSKSEIKRGIPVYFKFKDSTFNELAYRNIANWEHVDDPGEVECGGETNICILRVDSDNLTAMGSRLVQLDDFFENDLGTPGDVNSYVNATTNIEAKQN